MKRARTVQKLWCSYLGCNDLAVWRLIGAQDDAERLACERHLARVGERFLWSRVERLDGENK